MAEIEIVGATMIEPHRPPGRQPNGRRRERETASAPRANRYAVPVASQQMLRDICGPAHAHLQLLEQAFADDGVRVDSQAQSGEIVVTGDGDGARLAADALQAFARRIANGAEATAAELEAAITPDRQPRRRRRRRAMRSQGLRKPVMAQTPGQRAYLEKLRQDDLGLSSASGLPARARPISPSPSAPPNSRPASASG